MGELCACPIDSDIGCMAALAIPCSAVSGMIEWGRSYRSYGPLGRMAVLAGGGGRSVAIDASRPAGAELCGVAACAVGQSRMGVGHFVNDAGRFLVCVAAGTGDGSRRVGELSARPACSDSGCMAALAIPRASIAGVIKGSRASYRPYRPLGRMALLTGGGYRVVAIISTGPACSDLGGVAPLAV